MILKSCSKLFVWCLWFNSTLTEVDLINWHFVLQQLLIDLVLCILKLVLNMSYLLLILLQLLCCLENVNLVCNFVSSILYSILRLQCEFLLFDCQLLDYISACGLNSLWFDIFLCVCTLYSWQWSDYVVFLKLNQGRLNA